jgi:6,7-dimethyl-8-ribityllumazine synthase
MTNHFLTSRDAVNILAARTMTEPKTNHNIEGALRADGLRFAIVASRWNDLIVSRLVGGAQEALRRLGANETHIVTVRVPGSFEIPLVAKKLALSGRYDAIICVGAIIRGETPHYDYLAADVTKGISAVALETGVPVAYGVITADTVEQAIDRAGVKAGNKGFEAAMTAIEMANLLKEL